MARKTNTLVLSPWFGGLNSAEDPISLGLSPQGQQNLTQADNIIYTTTPGQKKRGGQAHFNSSVLTVSGSAVDGIYATTYWRNTASVKTEEGIIATEGGGLFRAPAYGTPSALTYSGVSPTFSQGQMTSEVINETLFIGYSKSNPALYYQGAGGLVASSSSSGAVVGTFPSGYLLRQHINRLFVAGDAANPDRLYYSAAELPFAYGTAGGFIDVYIGDGDPQGITAIYPPVNVNELYVAKRDKIYKVVTSDPSPANWPIVRVSDGIGCIQHNSVVAIDQGDILFASDRGIHSLQQILTSTAIVEGKFLSADIQMDYKNASNKKLISAIWAPDLNSYLFSLQRQGQTQIESVYGFNIARGLWYRWTSVPANYLFRRLNISTESYEYYSLADSTSASDRGYINKLQQTNFWDFSSATGNIVTLLKTPICYPGGNFLLERNWLNIMLLCRSKDTSPIQVAYVIDEEITGAGVINQRVLGGNVLGSTILGTAFILGAATGAKPLFMHISGMGNGLQVAIRHDTIGKDLQIYGLAIEYSEGEESEDAYRTFSPQ